MAKTTKTYEGKDVDVQWDGALCIHIGECGRAQGDLFVGGRQPWCQPDVVKLRRVTEVVERCPTGALTYTRKDGGPAEVPAAENTVHVVYNGPLYVRGELTFDGGGPRHRAALCRCGKSKNKPLCDNSHDAAGFRDFGAVGEDGEPLQARGGSLQIKAAKDGPLLLNGSFAIVTPGGRVAWTGTKAALCRCGESKNKPFCDGSHRAAGFAAD